MRKLFLLYEYYLVPAYSIRGVLNVVHAGMAGNLMSNKKRRMKYDALHIEWKGRSWHLIYINRYVRQSRATFGYKVED